MIQSSDIRKEFEQSLKRAGECVIDIQDGLFNVENRDDDIDAIVRLNESLAVARTHVAAWQARMAQLDRDMAAHPQPTDDDRVRRRELIEQGAPEVALFGPAAGVDQADVRTAQEITQAELEARETRSPAEETIYRGMEGHRPDVSIVEVEQARLKVAQIGAAIVLAEDRVQNNNRDVTSANFLKTVGSQAREAVDASLDRDYGPGTALAVHELRASLAANHELQQAQRDGLEPDQVEAQRKALDVEIERQVATRGDRSVLLSINLLPEPDRSQLGGSYQRVEQERPKNHALEQEKYKDVSPEQRAYVERKERIAQGRVDYLEIPEARENYERAAVAFDVHLDAQIRAHGGVMDHIVIDRDHVKLRQEIAEIRGVDNPQEQETARRLKAVLTLARPEGQEITARDIHANGQFGLDTPRPVWEGSQNIKALDRQQNGQLTQESVDLPNGVGNAQDFAEQTISEPAQEPKVEHADVGY